MSLATNVFWVLGFLLLVTSVAALRDGFRFLRYVRASRRQPLNNDRPSVTVVIPCKGLDSNLSVAAERFLSQQYPHFEVVFVVASEKDPAHGFLAERLIHNFPPDGPRPTRTSLVVAGYSQVRGEKVNNLLKGVEAANADSELLAFADADAKPGPDWLESLVSPLADPNVTVSTGFRWYIPGRNFASPLRAAWDTSIATLLGDHEHNFAWGGSMAIRAADFRRLRIAERYWANAVSDDYALTRAVREAGGKIHFQPRCLVASFEDLSLRNFWRWSNRQIIITRVYAPHLWGLGMAAHALYCGTWLLGVWLALARGPFEFRLAVGVILLVILALGMGKGWLRTLVAREFFPEENTFLTRYGASYWQLSPIVPWVMLGNFIVAAFSRRIEWGGTHYLLPSRNEVRVLRREEM